MLLKGLAEPGIDKNLIGNECLLAKLAKFEYEVAENDEDSEEYSEEEMASQDPMNDY